MSEKRLNRINRKKQKMAALVNLSQSVIEPNSASSTSKTHKQLIEELEQQIVGNDDVVSSNVKKRMAENDEETDEEGDGDIYSAYRQLVNKKRKIDQAKQMVQIYIDQHFLSGRRKKNLLYNENAPELTTPIALHACDVQQFIMYNLHGRNSMYRPRWCSIQFVTSITQLLVVLVEGTSWLDVNVSLPSAWPNTNHMFADKSIRMTSPLLYSADVEEDLFMAPLTQSEVANTHPKLTAADMKSLGPPDEEAEIDMDAILQTKDTFPRTMLILPFTDLSGEGYPVPNQSSDQSSGDLFNGFTFSKAKYKKVSNASPLYALDCEMVTTSDCKWSLASICIVDEKLNNVYKTLVKPDKPITDYLTKYSGITADMLDPITTTLADVQRDLRVLLPSDAVLCGQSLNNDLVALKMYHPFVIDSSVCYNLKGMPHSKTGLRRLASQFLRKDIQNGSSGHCPEEDARTTMELILLKLKIGYSFGNALADGIMATPSKFFKQKQVSDSGVANCKQEENLDLVQTHSTNICSSNNSKAEAGSNLINGEVQTESECRNFVQKYPLPVPSPNIPMVTEPLPVPSPNIPMVTEPLPVPSPNVPMVTELLPVPSPNIPMVTEPLPVPSPNVPMVTRTVSSPDIAVTEPLCVPSLNATVTEPGVKLAPDNSTPASAEISPLAAFSRNVIPQLEVNMFDLLGHHDNKTAVICTNCLSMREPQNSSHVTVLESRKTRTVIDNSKNALNAATNLVYSNIKARKESKSSNSAVKRYSLRTDEYISEMWDCLLPGGLLCLVLSGNKHHHGALMFNVKSQEQETRNEPANVDEDTDGDIYSTIYNCS